MSRRILAGILVCILSLMPTVCMSAQTTPLESELPFETNAVSVLLLDAATGTVIYEKNADEQRPVASITKLMTMLLVMEALDSGAITLGQDVTVSPNAAGMGGSQALLDAGGVYKLSELLKSLIIASANDSAVALAELLCGSEEAFAEKMNARAKELGLTATHYVNASGLPAQGQHTTARDVAALSREVLTHPIYFEYSTIWMDEIRHKNDRVTELVNTNRLIRFYDGADGVKTGSTNEAGFCISATAKRGEDRFIAVVLGCKSSTERFALAQKLLTYAFDHYTTVTHVKAGESVAKDIPVKGSSVKWTDLAAQHDLSYLANRGEENNAEIVVSAPEKIAAPMQKGTETGEAYLMLEGEKVASVPLVLSQDLPKNGFAGCIYDILCGWMKR